MGQCGRLGTSAKTFLNSSDAALTPREQGGQNLRVPVVYVLMLESGKILVPAINYLDTSNMKLFLLLYNILYQGYFIKDIRLNLL